MKIAIGNYLLKRLSELGIKHVFGVPGDYNLLFLDQIVNNPHFEWVGNCNELNGAYASDGYARIKGAGAIVTTFGVGELSAINGIAGAYAEYVPVVHIVGMPALATQARKAMVHHTLGSGDFSVYANMFSPITVATALLTPVNAQHEIDRVLTECWLKKRPVYIGLPVNICDLEIQANQEPLDLSYPTSEKEAVKEATTRIAELVTGAKHPVMLADICAIRHPMKHFIQDLLDNTGLPIATMNMGKGIIDENHPQFIGQYNGDFSSKGVQKKIESSDCVLSFGTLLSDFNTGGFTSKLNANVTIEIHSNHVKVKHSIYNNLYFADVIPALTKQLKKLKIQEKHPSSKPKAIHPKNKLLSQAYFWQRMSSFLKPDCIIAADTGTSLFGTLQMPIPAGATYIGQPLWGSIGYSVGSALGACLAAPGKQTILFVGDGSFQLTAQEVSTIIRHHLTPLIFLINNEGYTIERMIHGKHMAYNDIQKWDYTDLPHTFGNHVWSNKVTTETELEDILEQVQHHNKELIFTEVVMDKLDSPETLQKIGLSCAKQNQYY